MFKEGESYTTGDVISDEPCCFTCTSIDSYA